MPYITKSEIEAILVHLREAYNAATLETASFSHLAPRYGWQPGEDIPLPTKESEVTAFIRERMRLHHHTWVLSPLGECFRLLEKAARE